MGLNMKLTKDFYKIDYNLNNIGLKGMNDTSFCLYVNEIFEKEQRDIIIVAPTLFEANKLVDNLSVYNDKTLFFPMDDFLTSLAVAQSPDLKITRLETINNLLIDKHHILVTHLMGFLRFLPEKKLYEEKIIKLEKGMEYDPKKLAEDLINIGYIRDTIVSKTTDMAVRGYVIDVFPISQNHPIRFP